MGKIAMDNVFHYPLLFGYGWVSPWMLAWLAAAGVPILIHLWTRQRYRETPWAAMEYLLAAVRRHTRRMRLEQWVLLAVRTLLVALLVTAVAEPFLEGALLTSVSGGRTHRVLVIDGSYSMAYKPGEKSCFDRARELARQIVEESRQGDAFTLVLMSAPPRVVVGTPSLEPAEMIAEIDALQLPHATADLPATVDAACEVVRRAQRDEPRLERHEVYFLTDLGRVGWAPELSKAAAAGFAKRSKELADAATLVVIDLGQGNGQNLAVTDLRIDEPLVTSAKSVTFRARVKNFGPGACGRQRLELLVDGRPAGEATVGQRAGGLAPGGEGSAEFIARFETPGDHDVEVRLRPDPADDALDVDNRRYLAVPVKPYVRVLCINGRPSGGPYRDATDYLRVALAPEGERAEGSSVRVEVVPESALRESALDRYDCVFLVDVAQFVPGEAQLLRSYLRHGGGLVFFLGDQVQAANYNEQLDGEGPDAVRLLPARLGAVRSDGPFGFDPLEYEHPIVAAFRGREGAGLLSAPVDKYIRLSVPKDSKARVALAFSSGDPAVVAEPIERGRVAVVATSADVSWSPMPLSPVYVPMVQEVLGWALRGQLQQRNYRVGQVLGELVSVPADVALRIETPGGRSEPIRMTPEGDSSSWSFSETMTSGIYAARFGPPVGRSDLFAANVDTVESNLTQMTPEELGRGVWAGVPFETSRQDLDDEPVRRIVGRGDTFSWVLLCGVLGLLLTETFLAWRFGHHAT